MILIALVCTFFYASLVIFNIRYTLSATISYSESLFGLCVFSFCKICLHGSKEDCLSFRLMLFDLTGSVIVEISVVEECRGNTNFADLVV